MNRAAEVITREILRAEKNIFMLRVAVAAGSYLGISLWLNAIRQTVSAWVLWLLVGLQLFLFLTIFVICSLRMRQCQKPRWWLWFPLLLSRINNWEVVAIPATIIVTLVLSERNKYVSQQREHLLASEEDEKAETEGEINRLRHDLKLLENPETIFSFGQMTFDGDGVEQDYVQAASWYKIAAEQGHAKAQHNLALMYEQGQGVPRDSALAAKYYRMAAEQGHTGSQNNLGALYESGSGVPQDNTMALNLYRQAADSGDPNAVSNLDRLRATMAKQAT